MNQVIIITNIIELNKNKFFEYEKYEQLTSQFTIHPLENQKVLKFMFVRRLEMYLSKFLEIIRSSNH